MIVSHPELDEVRIGYLRTDRVSRRHRAIGAGQKILQTNHQQAGPAYDPQMLSCSPSELLVRPLSSPTKAALPVRAPDAFCSSIWCYGHASFRSAAYGNQ